MEKNHVNCNFSPHVIRIQQRAKLQRLLANVQSILVSYACYIVCSIYLVWRVDYDMPGNYNKLFRKCHKNRFIWQWCKFEAKHNLGIPISMPFFSSRFSVVSSNLAKKSAFYSVLKLSLCCHINAAHSNFILRMYCGRYQANICCHLSLHLLHRALSLPHQPLTLFLFFKCLRQSR